MKSINEILKEKRNEYHIEHSEDLILQGSSQMDLLYSTFSELFESLKGNSSRVVTTLKIDGSPGFIAASDFNGQSFISTKSFFNNTSVIFYTEADIDNYYKDKPQDYTNLVLKLKTLLKYVVNLRIPHNEIWRGDFLFYKTELKEEMIDGENYLTFTPNTICYAIKVGDPIYYLLKEAEFGVAWHTKYLGDSLDDLRVSYDVSVNSLVNLPQVFQMDSKLPSIIGKGIMTAEDTQKINNWLNDFYIIANNGSFRNFLNAMNSNLRSLLASFRTAQTKLGLQDISYLNEESFLKYVKDVVSEKIQNYKRASYKEKKFEELEEFIQYLKNNIEQLSNLFLLQYIIVQIKELFIIHLNTLCDTKTFVRDIDKGYISCGPEGFAVSDAEGNIQKLVSRIEFSKNNFSQNIVKSWVRRGMESLAQ